MLGFVILLVIEPDLLSIRSVEGHFEIHVGRRSFAVVLRPIRRTVQ